MLRVTPCPGRLDRAEAICESMQSRGYALTRVGRFFMHFTRTDESFIYRAELSKRIFRSFDGSCGEYDPAYKSCGWQALPSKDYFRFYRAKSDAEAPVIDPKLRTAASRKLVIFNLIAAVLIIAMLMWFFAPLIFPLGSSRSAAAQLIRISEDRVLLPALALFLVWALLDLICLVRLHFANRRGARFAAPSFPTVPYLAGSLFMAAAMLFTNLFNSCTLPKPRALPEAAQNEPYLLTSELGIETARRELDGKTSELSEDGLWLSRNLHTEEYTEAGFLYQDIYCAHSPQLAKKLLEALKLTKSNGHYEKTMEQLSIDGFDEVWMLHDNCFVVMKGKTAAAVWLYFYDGTESAAAAALKALAEKLNNN